MLKKTLILSVYILSILCFTPPLEAPDGREPPPTPPGPEAGVEAPPEEGPQLNEEQARERMRRSQEGLSLFANALRGQLNASRRDVDEANNILDSFERELERPGIEWRDGIAVESAEETELRQRIENMTRAAREALRFAGECYEEAYSAARRVYLDLSARIGLSTLRSQLAEARQRTRLAGPILRGTVVTREAALPPEAFGLGAVLAPPIATYYNIESLRAESEWALSQARGAGIHPSDQQYQGIQQARYLAETLWNTLRESQEYRELSDKVAALRQRLEYLTHALSVYEELFEENESRARSYMADAETALEQCRRQKEREKAEAQKEPSEADLSGTWLQMKGDKPIKEWEIRTDKKGKLTLVEPSGTAPGKVVEFSGSVEGNNITARHIIKDPDLVDPTKMPRKVIETAVKEYMPTWDLDLKVSKDGTTLEGKQIGFNVNYNPDTLEVAWVKPRFEKELVLKRKEEKPELAKGPDRIRDCMRDLRNFNQAVEEQRRGLEANQRERDALNESISRLQSEFDSHIRQGFARYSSASDGAQAGDSGRCSDLKGQATAENVRAGRVIQQVESACRDYTNNHERLTERYNALINARPAVENCIGVLRGTRNREQEDLMHAAQFNLDNSDSLQPPELDREDLNRPTRDMEFRRTRLREAIDHLECDNRYYRPVAIPYEELPPEEQQRMLREAAEQLPPEEREREMMRRIREKLERGEALTPEEEERYRRALGRALGEATYWLSEARRISEKLQRGEPLTPEEQERWRQIQRVAGESPPGEQPREELDLGLQPREGIPPRTPKGLEKGPEEEPSAAERRQRLQEVEEIMRRRLAGERLSPEELTKLHVFWAEGREILWGHRPGEVLSPEDQEIVDTMRRHMEELGRAEEGQRQRPPDVRRLEEIRRRLQVGEELSPRDLGEIRRRLRAGEDLSLSAEELQRLRIGDLVKRHLLGERDDNGMSELERRRVAGELFPDDEEEIERLMRREGGEEHYRQHPEEIKAILRRAARGEDLSEGDVRRLEFYRNAILGQHVNWPWLNRVIDENSRFISNEEEILQYSHDSELGGIQSFYLYIINERRVGRRVTNQALLDRLLELRRHGLPDKEYLPIGYGEQLEEGIDDYIQESREEIENLQRTLRFGAGGVEP